MTNKGFSDYACCSYSRIGPNLNALSFVHVKVLSNFPIGCSLFSVINKSLRKLWVMVYFWICSHNLLLNTIQSVVYNFLQHWVWQGFWLLCNCWSYQEDQGLNNYVNNLIILLVVPFSQVTKLSCFLGQVFEYGTVIRDVVDIHYPVNEMVCNSKIRWVLV